MADPIGAHIAGALRRWATDKALPLWSTNGFDAKRGGFQERLNPDGSPDVNAPRRLRVQARQIYVYAHAAALGWFVDGRRFMMDGVAFMVERYRSPDGKPGRVHPCARQFGRRPAARHIRSYVCLVGADLGRESQRRRADPEISRRRYRLYRWPPHRARRQFHPGIPQSQPRRQNPHMHAFEAMLAMHETIAYPQAMARAQKLLTMMNEKILRRKKRNAW